MTWTELTADLDAAVFEHLSDDPAATVTRGGVILAVVPVMLDRAERPAARPSFATLEREDVLRVSVAQLAAEAPGVVPQADDLWLVSGRTWQAHARAWHDDQQDGHDWLIPVRTPV